MDVPLKKAKPFPGTDELIGCPGASKSRKLALFEKLETLSVLVVDPTLIADEIQAGAASALVNPSLPDEITVAIPTERSRSIAAFLGSPSQNEPN